MSKASAAAATATTATSAKATGDATASETVASASGFNSENTGAASAVTLPVGGAFAVLLGLAGLF